MENNLVKNIEIIKNLNTDDSRFIINIYEAYHINKKEIEKRIKNSTIILKKDFINQNIDFIDLDEIWAKPYFYTKMRLHLEGIIGHITKLEKVNSKTLKKIIFHKTAKKFEKSEKQVDIVDFIQELKQREIENKNMDFIYVAEQIDEETIFKQEQLQKAIEIIKLKSKEEQYIKIYDEVYSYLKKDFVGNHYCDFKENKCVAKRHFSFYPINRRNGCCFTQVKTCSHLQKGGKCDVECMACRLFSCPYLTKRGIAYYGSEIVIFRAFLNKKQRKELVFDFYKDKSEVINKLVQK